MILTTNNRSMELKLSTRNVVNMLNAIGSDDVKTLVFEGMHKNNMELLGEVIRQLSGTASLDEVYDFIDDYKREHQCSVQEIYKNIITELNENYFFDLKMAPEELAEYMNNPMNWTMEKLMKEYVEKTIEKNANAAVIELAQEMAEIMGVPSK